MDGFWRLPKHPNALALLGISILALAVNSSSARAAIPDTLHLDPATPATGSTLRIYLPKGHCSHSFAQHGITQVAGTYRIEIKSDPAILFTGIPCARKIITVGPLVSGMYEVYFSGLTAPAPTSPARTFKVTPSDVESADLFFGYSGTPDITGFWSDGTSGAGLSIQRDPGSGRMFAALFTHGRLDRPQPSSSVATALWLYAPDIRMTGNAQALSLSGALHFAINTQDSPAGAGGGFAPIPPYPVVIVNQRVGSFSIRFDDEDSATVTVRIDAPVMPTLASQAFAGATDRDLVFRFGRYRF